MTSATITTGVVRTPVSHSTSAALSETAADSHRYRRAVELALQRKKPHRCGAGKAADDDDLAEVRAARGCVGVSEFSRTEFDPLRRFRRSAQRLMLLISRSCPGPSWRLPRSSRPDTDSCWTVTCRVRPSCDRKA